MEFNKKNIKVILGIISFTIIFAAVCIKFSAFMTFVSSVFSVVMPFIAGGAIAFVLNVFAKYFQGISYAQILTAVILMIIVAVFGIVIPVKIAVLQPSRADARAASIPA